MLAAWELDISREDLEPLVEFFSDKHSSRECYALNNEYLHILMDVDTCSPSSNAFWKYHRTLIRWSFTGRNISLGIGFEVAYHSPTFCPISLLPMCG